MKQRFKFELLVNKAWVPVDIKDIVLGNTIRFYDAGHLAFHQQTKETEWKVDADMIKFIEQILDREKTRTVLPTLELKDAEISSGSYSDAFGWIMDRMQDGDMTTLNELFESYDPEIHSAEFMSGILRCASSQKRRIPAWLPVLKKVTIALGEPLMGMHVDKMEAELAAEAKPDALGSLFDQQILKVHPALIRQG